VGWYEPYQGKLSDTRVVPLQKGKYEAAGKFVERMKRIQEKAKAVLGKV